MIDIKKNGISSSIAFSQNELNKEKKEEEKVDYPLRLCYDYLIR